MWGNVPRSAFCSRSWSRGTKSFAETLEFFNLKPKVRSSSLSFMHSFLANCAFSPPPLVKPIVILVAFQPTAGIAETPSSRFLCRIAGKDKDVRSKIR